MQIWSAEIKELESLYTSIKGRLPELEKELDRLVKADDENMVLLYSRRSLEVIITDLCENELKRPRGTEPLKGIIDKLNHEDKVPANIIVSMQGLNSLSTFGAHPKEFDPEQVRPVLINLSTIIKWYLKYKNIRFKIKHKEPEREKINEITEPPTISKLKNKTVIIVSGIIIISVIGIIVFNLFNLLRTDKFESVRNSDGRISIAVMSFENLTGDSTLNFWQRGIPEILINDLGSSKELLVMSSPTMYEVFQSMGESYTASIQPVVANKTAKKLKTGIYVNGKYQKTRDKLRILVNVINTEDGSILWSNKVDGNPMSDYLQMADSISKILKNYLEIKALKEEADYDYREAFTESAEAYRFYMEGVDLILNENYELAKQPLMKALRIDSTFAMASFYMAWANLYSSHNMDDVRKWINKAYLNKENLPTIYQNWIGIWYSMFISKDRDEILRYCDLLSQSDINSRIILFDIGLTYKNFAQYEKAVNEFEKITKINDEWGENWKNAVFYRGSSSINGHNAYHECGKHKMENELYEIGLSLFPDDIDILSRKTICALSRGDTSETDNFITKIVSLLNNSSKTEAYINLHLASIYESAKLFDKSEQKYKKALELEPENLWTYYHMIQMMIDNDYKFREAMEMNQKILDQYPDDIRFIKLKGAGFCKQRKFAEGLKLLKKWEEVYPFEERIDPYIREAEQALANQYK